MKKALFLSLTNDEHLALSEALKAKLIDLDFSSSKDPFNNLDPTMHYEMIFADINYLKKNFSEVQDKEATTFRQIKRLFPSAKVLVLCNEPEIREAITYIRTGADDYISLPLKPTEVSLVVDRIFEAVRQKAEVEHLKKHAWTDTRLSQLLNCHSRAMQQVLDQIQSVMETKSTVLLLGETGVGKSMIAKIIHDNSPRKLKPFVSVHCGAISENLVESELFGHEKGAFTDAVKRKLGKFEIANGGTIFLDEVGTVLPTTQIKLLQVLQDSMICRVGGENEIKVDSRVIAATNENLEQLVADRKFRSDLFYRLNVFPIHIPALRERVEDISALSEYFIKKFNGVFGREIQGLSDQALEILESYNWPGNIRELENVLERSFILEKTDFIMPESLPLQMNESHENTAVVPMDTELTLAEVRSRSIDSIERQYLKDLLTKTKGKVNEAANISGVGLRQFHKLLTKYQLKSKDFKNSQIKTLLERDKA